MNLIWIIILWWGVPMSICLFIVLGSSREIYNDDDFGNMVISSFVPIGNIGLLLLVIYVILMWLFKWLKNMILNSYYKIKSRNIKMVMTGDPLDPYGEEDWGETE